MKELVSLPVKTIVNSTCWYCMNLFQGPGAINIYTYDKVDTSIYLRPTVPVVCGCCQNWMKNTNGDCTISNIYAMIYARHNITNILYKHACTYSIGQGDESLKIPLSVKRRPGSTDGVQQFKIEFKPLDRKLLHGSDPYIWENYVIPSILVSRYCLCGFIKYNKYILM